MQCGWDHRISLHQAAKHFALAICCFFLIAIGNVHAQLEFESKPISYEKTAATDQIAWLQKQINSGEIKLKHDKKHGYLRDVLKHLGISSTSQVLVFSKTSFQLRLIDPHRPRSVYFNDNVYIGWVQGSDVLEISTADPKLGAVFYTLPQDKVEKPKFVRDRGQCLTCHASSRTSGVPGHLVRSVYAGRSGEPFFGSGTFTTDHRSPFEERWGGWYVTGTHGKLRHMGNAISHDRKKPEDLDVEAGANVTDLNNKFNVEAYLTPHSDIVSLMVLEHQVRMQNLITRAGFETRIGIYYDQVINIALKQPLDKRGESTQRRIESAGNDLVKYMLFSEEFKLKSPVKGTSAFTEKFAQEGPHDSKGRSLRDFDLKKRLMKYPCSFQIYSKQFAALPEPVKEHVYKRLWTVLHEEGPKESFSHLSRRDRKAIVEILVDTKKDLPSYWKK